MHDRPHPHASLQGVEVLAPGRAFVALRAGLPDGLHGAQFGGRGGGLGDPLPDELAVHQALDVHGESPQVVDHLFEPPGEPGQRRALFHRPPSRGRRQPF
ncbi:hypothetical protein [Nonomuraea rubra]|uniref:hypothetical protein n=1 Tax=Nonomuraea rubra TaxID=46180 RepID=UPI0033EAED92